jgi:hypothetical protein
VLRRLGQQSLAIFMSGLVLSLIASVCLNMLGRGVVSVALINLAGIGLLFVVARIASYFKSQPWQKPAPQPAPILAVSAQPQER